MTTPGTKNSVSSSRMYLQERERGREGGRERERGRGWEGGIERGGKGGREREIGGRGIVKEGDNERER